MRYTTLIDISEVPEVYGNINARLLYLHMVLKSGYHDEDRDQLRASLRQLAAAAGLTLSATRHALRILGASGLVQRDGEIWRVKKWLVATPPTPRTQKNTARAGGPDPARVAEQAKSDETRKAQIAAYQQQLMAAVRKCERSELIAWREELKEGRRIRHHDGFLPPNKASIDWLTKIIDGA